MSSPKVGFVSLGCPKNTVDSERILTQLRTEGYEISPSYEGADVVLVNTCGFIDSAVEESLESIGEALRENGKVIVTGRITSYNVCYTKLLRRQGLKPLSIIKDRLSSQATKRSACSLNLAIIVPITGFRRVKDLTTIKAYPSAWKQ